MKKLMELVGSIIVQQVGGDAVREGAVRAASWQTGPRSCQAGLSVMNAQKGVLPHGWLEYIDDNSGRPYYYNVHTRETTWRAQQPLSPSRLSRPFS